MSDCFLLEEESKMCFVCPRLLFLLQNRVVKGKLEVESSSPEAVIRFEEGLNMSRRLQLGKC